MQPRAHAPVQVRQTTELEVNMNSVERMVEYLKVGFGSREVGRESVWNEGLGLKARKMGGWGWRLQTA